MQLVMGRAGPEAVSTPNPLCSGARSVERTAHVSAGGLRTVRPARAP